MILDPERAERSNDLTMKGKRGGDNLAESSQLAYDDSSRKQFFLTMKIVASLSQPRVKRADA